LSAVESRTAERPARSVAAMLKGASFRYLAAQALKR